MTDTEKITINLSVVDLGKIDLLVDQGHFASRSDLIRTAIREKLSAYADEVKEITVRQSVNIGVNGFTKKDLERKKAKGEMVSINTAGMMIITNDVSPELALETIESVRCFGVFKASKAVKDALEKAGRIK